MNNDELNNDDALIQSQVEDTIKNTRFLHNADINIETRNGEVTLLGFVDVLAEKWAAGEVVEKIPGVVSVDNSLTVAMDRSVEDSTVSEMIQEKLVAGQLSQVSPIVKEGVAYLEGRVETLADEENAKEIAANVRGVKDVVSNLGMLHEGFPVDDASITNFVETAFSRSTLVSARDIETRTRNGNVTLQGSVDTAAQIEAAVRIASGVPGVKKITNQLNARHESPDRDYRLTNDIRNELGDNGFGGVRCFVVDGMAFLEGTVGTPDQKYKAEELVGRFDDIDGIHNDIQIV